MIEVPPSILAYTGAVHKVDVPRQGHTSHVSILHTENGTYVLKRTKGERFTSWLARERTGKRFLRATVRFCQKLRTNILKTGYISSFKGEAGWNYNSCKQKSLCRKSAGCRLF